MGREGGVMRVSVTGEHIAAGEPGQYSTCPIALAVSEATGCHCEVSEQYGVARVVIERGPGEGEGCFWQELPEGAYRFVRDFDEGLPVAPLELDLREEYWEACDDE